MLLEVKYCKIVTISIYSSFVSFSSWSKKQSKSSKSAPVISLMTSIPPCNGISIR